MADFLEDKKREIRSRLTELKPLVDEYHLLEAAAAALDGVRSDGARSGSTTGRRTRSTSRTRSSSSSQSGTGTTSRRGSSATKTTTGRRGRPRGSGTRSKQALEIVRSRPGVTIAELAD